MEQQKSFKNWKAQEIENAFGVKRKKHSEVLDSWLRERPNATEKQLSFVEMLRGSAEDDIDAWNEAALKFFFIGPLITLIDFNTEDYHGFLEQTLTIQNDKITARGNIDFMVAAGREIPESPFYLLHEYKPEFTTIIDPKGQLLIAMVSAQQANEKRGLTQPIYGTYVIGRLWFFVVLNGKEYTISRGFDCTQPDGIEAIFYSLLQVKAYIEALHVEVSE